MRRAPLLVALATMIAAALATLLMAAPFSPRDYDSVGFAERVNLTNILIHINKIIGFGSRLTGYEGCYRTSEYIVSILRSYGLNVTIHRYKVVVPLDEGSRVVVLDDGGNEVESFPAYALWPNGVNPSPTPPEGLVGKLIYVGKGTFEELEGKDLRGRIALMDYDSYDNYLNVAKLGAKAVIFIEPEDIPPYFENLKKFTDVPISFPRLYVTRDIGNKLIKLASLNRTVRVHANVRWKEVEAENVVGILDGESAADTILITTHYDSWSPVPRLATSAHEALPVGYLLELARVLSEARVKPPRTLWFVFFSGYWQALAGPREFVERYYFGPEVEKGLFRPLMLINIGFLDPNGIGIQILRGGHGTFYGTTGNMGGIALRYAWVLRKINDYVSSSNFSIKLLSMTGIDPARYVRDYFTNTMYWGTEPFPYMLASEPAEMTGGIAFTLQSMYAFKQWLGSPVSDLRIVNSTINLLRPQVFTITYLVTSFAFERNFGVSWSEVAPARVRIVGPSFQYSGFITLRGKVLAYNLTKGWYSEVPNAIVRVYVGSFAAGSYFVPPYPFNKMITLADMGGRFEVHGLAPYPLIPGVGAAGGGLVRSMYVVEAWKIDEASGQILYAPDLGLYGARMIPPVVSPLAPVEEVSVVVNKFESLALFDLINPREGRPAIIPDPRTLSYGDTFTAFFAVGGGLQVLDFGMRGEPLSFGAYYNGYEPLGLAFFQPGTRVAVLFRIGGLAQPISLRPMAVVVNATAEQPEGTGLSGGGAFVTCFDYARDLLLVTKSRYQRLVARGVRSGSVEEKLSLAEELYKRALAALSERKYGEAYSHAIAAWSLAQRAYEETMGLIDDSSRTSLFFFAMAIPTAIFLERLLLHKEGRGRILSTIATGAALVALFAASHPALHVMTNSGLSLLGMVALLLFATTVSVLIDETRQALREISYRLLGMHEIETRRVAIASSAFTVALENMRRRRVRTLLTVLTFVSITIAVTSLTSLSPFEAVKGVALGVTPSYRGLLVKSGFGVPPRDVYGMATLRLVGGILRGFALENASVLLPRSWYYPVSVGPAVGVTSPLTTEAGLLRNNTYIVAAAVGMVPEDVKATLGEYLTPGSRPFLRGEVYACIIPDSAAKQLGVSVGDFVLFQGLKLLVTGIYNASLLEAASPRELDGYPVSPVDPKYVPQLGLGVTVPAQQVLPSLSWSSVIIVPFDLAVRLGGYISMISVRFTNASSASELAAKVLAVSLDIPVVTSDGKTVWALSRYYTFVAIGWEMIPVVLIIGALNASLTLLGNFRERLREMSVYAALGLAPLGAAVMHVIEALTYATLSITVGYFLGFAINNALLRAGILPASFTFNYASIFVVISLGVLLLTALASSLQVAFSAATIITPSLERRWRPPTKPRGDAWEIPLPVSVPSEAEARGALAYLFEYYSGAGAVREGVHVVRELAAPDYGARTLTMVVALAPLEAGVQQRVSVEAVYDRGANRYVFLAHLQRLSGSDRVWVDSNYKFIDDLRKQLLMWSSLPPQERRRYVASAASA